jgi:hypothetical protein
MQGSDKPDQRRPGEIYQDEFEVWTDWKPSYAEWTPEDFDNAPSEAVDYSKSKVFTDNVALYTPALSETIVSVLDKANPDIAGSGFSNIDLQITNPQSRLFFYPWVLYSAGQAAGTATQAKQRNWLTTKPRDPRVVLLGDSGGYQVQQDTIHFDTETPGRLLSWLEDVADYSMTLDFPVGGIESGSLTRHIERMTREGIDVSGQAQQHGFSVDYMACLLQTKRNNEEFDAKRQGKTKFLNVIQGRNERESAFWYEQVKTFDAAGWAFAGKHHTQLSMTVMRLLDMKRDGLLQSCQWIHFLGISTLRAGMILSYLQRVLRSTGMAPNVQITFDSASPVKLAANAYQAVLGFETGRDNWSFKPHKVAAEELLGEDLTIGHLATNWAENQGHRRKVITYVGETVKFQHLLTERQGERATLNSEQFALLAHHNTQAYIEGFRNAYRYLGDSSRVERPLAVSSLLVLLERIFTQKGSYDFARKAQIELDELMYEQV